VTGLRWFETYVPKSLLPILLERDEPTLEPKELEVSVLFTDIIGFSHTGERLEAPHLADFLNRHFALLGECIQAEGGTIDKYIGDSVMAFWGAPLPQSDHAERACRAALAIAAHLAADNERRHAKDRPPVRIRLGLHCGTALAGNIGAPGRINYTLVGDTVNVAQRLEQFGKQVDDSVADAIIIASADFVARIPAEVAREPLGRQLLPGRVTETEVFRLLAARPSEGSAGRAEPRTGCSVV
jgi:adenylate cyclase